MVDEISNKTLAILLIAAIAVSLGGTLFSLNRLARLSGMTGYVTNPRALPRSMSARPPRLGSPVSSLNFGTGSVNTTSGNQYCSMASNHTTGYQDAVSRCIGFNGASTYKSLEIENDGNRNLTITMASTKNADTFIGGTAPAFKFYTTVNESLACGTPVPTGWVDVNISSVNLCTSTGGLDFSDNSDSLDIHLNITIPYNSLTDQQSVTLTVTGSTF